MIPAITVIGCDGGPLPGPAAAALAAARCVAGTRRHLAAAAVPAAADRIEFGKTLTTARGLPAPPPGTQAPAGPMAWAAAARQAHAASVAGAAGAAGAAYAAGAAGAFDAALSAIFSHPGPVAILASGDPGFFGIVRALTERGAAPTVIPAPSCVALAFARLGLPWDDALVLSAHGRDPKRVLAAALGCAKAAILTAPGPAAGPSRFIPALLDAGRSVYVAERLGAPDERLTEISAGQVERTGEFADPNVVISLDAACAPGTPGTPGAPGAPGKPRWMAGHTGAPDRWALAEDEFEHRDSMITKAEVRALVLARLGPGPGRTIWDIGSGSGSVAVECARFGAYVIAIEADPAQCARIRANAVRHAARLHVAEGSAPRVLNGLLPADAVFVGGGGDPVLRAAAAARPARIVVALACVDRVRPVRDLLTSQGYRVEGTALQASRLAATPAGSVRLAAANPVFVLWGDRR